MLIHNVINEPMEEIDGQWSIVVRAQDQGSDELFDTELYFDTLDNAYKFSNHFKVSIEPIEIKEGLVDGV